MEKPQNLCKRKEEQKWKDDYEEEQQMRTIPNQSNQRRYENRGDDDFWGIQIQVPLFQDISDPKAYLEWEVCVDQIFSCQSYSKGKKVKLAALEITNYALVWWDQMKKETLRMFCNNLGRDENNYEETITILEKWSLTRKI